MIYLEIGFKNKVINYSSNSRFQTPLYYLATRKRITSIPKTPKTSPSNVNLCEN